MIVNDIAVVRTGLVTTRKKKTSAVSKSISYRLLNLKCISPEGYIETAYLESYESPDELKEDYLTQPDDILIRLSAPYTAVIINRPELLGLLVPSHFAIIRTDRQYVAPEYLFWTLRREKKRIELMQNSSGSTAFGTISSGLIGSLNITPLPLEKQKIIGNLMLLSEQEQELLDKLSAEKKKYNTLLLNQIYDNMKRSKIE